MVTRFSKNKKKTEIINDAQKKPVLFKDIKVNSQPFKCVTENSF